MNARHRQVNDAQPETCEKQTHVVPKDILHELDRILWHDLVEHDLHLLRGRSLQLLLDEPRPVLVPAELDNIPKDVLDRFRASASYRNTDRVVPIKVMEQLPTRSSHLRDLLARNSSSCALRTAPSLRRP